jgi:hypothetical protein
MNKDKDTTKRLLLHRLMLINLELDVIEPALALLDLPNLKEEDWESIERVLKTLGYSN